MFVKKTIKSFKKSKDKKTHSNETDALLIEEQLLNPIESSEKCGISLIHSTSKWTDALRMILSEQSNQQVLCASVRQWRVLHENNMDEFYKKSQVEIDQFVENTFSFTPLEGAQGVQESLNGFLLRAEEFYASHVLRLSLVLKEAGLLDLLIDSYHHQLFNYLELFLDRDLSQEEIFDLLQRAMSFFFSPDTPIVSKDPLRLMGWFVRAKNKLQEVMEIYIPCCLNKILSEYEKKEKRQDWRSEEDFISLHIDVIGFLNAVIKDAETFSECLMYIFQDMCHKELYNFVKKYVDVEYLYLKSRTLSIMDVFRVIGNCRQLKYFALKITPRHANTSKNLPVASELENLERLALSILERKIRLVAQESLSCYFRRKNEYFNDLMSMIQSHCDGLPQTQLGQEIQMMYAALAFSCVSNVYLDSMLKTKYKHLMKRWGNVGEKMKEDALKFIKTFSQLNVDIFQYNVLEPLSEVLIVRDIEALKLTCAESFQIFQKDSERYVARLLHWKGELSKQKIKEILQTCECLEERHKRMSGLSGGLCWCCAE